MPENKSVVDLSEDTIHELFVLADMWFRTRVDDPKDKINLVDTTHAIARAIHRLADVIERAVAAKIDDASVL